MSRTLDDLIDEAGVGPTAVAEAAGMSARTLLGMRNGEGRTWRVATLANLATALDVSVGELRKAIKASEEAAKKG